MADEVSSEAIVDEPTDERPETLAAALGEDGPGIAAEIENELSADPESESELDGPVVSEPTTNSPTSETPDISSRLGLLSDVEVMVTVRLCVTSHPLGRVLSMTPGSTLDLGMNTDAPIELLANGVLVAYGEVVAVDGHLGVRITALADG